MRTLARNLTAAGAVVAIALAVTGCRESEPEGSASAPEPTEAITLEAMTIGPAEPLDDPYCQIAVEALNEWSTLVAGLETELPTVVAAAVLAGDMSGINALGSELNSSIVLEKDFVADAILIVEDDPEVDAALAQMGVYLDSVSTPVALMLVAATDINALSTELGTFFARPDIQALVADESGYAATVAAYTEVRCDVDLGEF